MTNGTGREAGSTGPSDNEMAVAFSPKGAAVGFAIIASLVLLLVGRSRRRRDRGS